jgi:pyruvate/2-oxoglutarate dehydrogenase complex dihydrolipoamide dehydrogenase (E3) component
MPDYDVIVLGGGSAGSSAAEAASAAGARTLMINDGELGGLCILRGCMPTKTLLATAHAVHEANHLDRFGAHLEGRTTVDFPRVMQRKTEKVERFKQAKVRSIESAGYEVLDARARFAAGGGVEAGGRKLSATRYVIATGSAPQILSIPGIDDVPLLTSDDVMRLTVQPRSLVVQGAGPIGLELAQFFARIGTEVLLVNRSPLLSRLDPVCGAELRRVLQDEPRIELAVPGCIEKLVPDGDGLVATVDDGERSRTYRADALLMATGRRALVDEIGLEHVGLNASSGCLEHDDSMRTTHTDIYVAGDSTGRNQILHVANDEGRVAGHNAAVGRPERRVDERLLMDVIFTDPPYAQVGLTELRARDAGCDVVVGQAKFPETGRAITMETAHGIWRLVADKAGGEILGASILGPRADDLVHSVMLLVRHATTASEIQELPWYHPTLTEVLLDLSRDILRQSTPRL